MSVLKEQIKSRFINKPSLKKNKTKIAHSSRKEFSIQRRKFLNEIPSQYTPESFYPSSPKILINSCESVDELNQDLNLQSSDSDQQKKAIGSNEQKETNEILLVNNFTPPSEEKKEEINKKSDTKTSNLSNIFGDLRKLAENAFSSLIHESSSESQISDENIDSDSDVYGMKTSTLCIKLNNKTYFEIKF